MYYVCIRIYVTKPYIISMFVNIFTFIRMRDPLHVVLVVYVCIHTCNIVECTLSILHVHTYTVHVYMHLTSCACVPAGVYPDHHRAAKPLSNGSSETRPPNLDLNARTSPRYAYGSTCTQCMCTPVHCMFMYALSVIHITIYC